MLIEIQGNIFESGLREVLGGERFTNLIIVALILVKPTISHNLFIWHFIGQIRSPPSEP